jgi:hypothetical protein
LAAPELSVEHLAPIANLNTQLAVISHSPQESFVWQKIPFILIRVILNHVAEIFTVNLEATNLFKQWTDILNVELRKIELLVEHSVSEHHLFPNKEPFAQRSVLLFPALRLEERRIEHALWNLNVRLSLYKS